MEDQSPLDRKLLENAFPKKCGACHKLYKSYDEFLQETVSLPNGSLSEGPRQSVLAYRNCDCGSTLTIKLEDLRDYSEKGIKQREEFKKRLGELEGSGIKTEQAIAQVKKEMGL